jgi:hypothetical protein
LITKGHGMKKALYLYRGRLAGKVILATDIEVEQAISGDYGKPLGARRFPELDRSPHAAADRFTDYYLDRQIRNRPHEGAGRVVAPPSSPSPPTQDAPAPDKPAESYTPPKAKPKPKPKPKGDTDPQEKGAA